MEVKSSGAETDASERQLQKAEMPIDLAEAIVTDVKAGHSAKAREPITNWGEPQIVTDTSAAQ